MYLSSNWRSFSEVPKSCSNESNRDEKRTRRREFGLRRGLHCNKHDKTKTQDVVNQSIAKNSVTRAVSLDCEMVGVQDGRESILARVSIVDGYGHCLYDTFVKPTEAVVDYRTNVSGVRPKDMEKGVDFHVAQKVVADLLRGRVLVGHDVKNDLKVLFISHPRKRIRDTAWFAPFRTLTKGNTPSLKRLANDILGVKLQEGEHSSVEDARAAMLLYNMFKEEWECNKMSGQLDYLSPKENI